MLRLAFVNLISNAVKFTPKAHAKPRSQIVCLEKKSERVTMFIKDKRSRLDMKYVNKLFGYFNGFTGPEAFDRHRALVSPPCNGSSIAMEAGLRLKLVDRGAQRSSLDSLPREMNMLRQPDVF